MISSPPNEVQLDALREVANVGGGHAANAFSKLVGGRAVKIEVPRVVLSRLEELPQVIGASDARVVAAGFQMLGEFKGCLLWVLPESDAHLLCGLLLGSPSVGPFTETQRSALSEAANIVVSAGLAAVGTFTGLKLMPSTPSLWQNTPVKVVENVWNEIDHSSPAMVVMQVFFSASTTPHIGGQLIVLPERDSLARLLTRLGL
jgi:chemotaxis protein CheC